MTNFNFLLSVPDFVPFGEVAAAAEKIYSIDPAACVLNCRRAMEFAVKWMYSVDSALVMPWDDKLVSLLGTEEFRDIVDANLMRRLEYIRKVGNCAAHDGKKVTKEQAMLCLQNLWVFMDFIAYCYGTNYQPGIFDPALPEQTAAPVYIVPPETEIQLAKLIEENAALKQELTSRREEQQAGYTPKPLDLSEYDEYLYEDDTKIVYNMREDLHQHGIDEVVYEQFKPVIYSPSSNLVHGLGEPDTATMNYVMPAELGGFYGTKARDESELILVGNYDVPVYAQWKFGKGMVGSFMCDIGGKWGSEFAADASCRTFIRNVVGNLVPTEDIREKSMVTDLRQENYVNQLNIYASLNEGETITGKITDISTSAETEKAFVTPEGDPEYNSDFYVLTGLSEENSYSRCTFVVKKSGVYKLTLEKRDADGNVLETVEKYKTFSYSKEYDNFTETAQEDIDNFLATVAKRGNGSVINDLEDPIEVFKDFVTELIKTYDPRNLFMILAIILFLFDIIVRKFKFLWPHEIPKWLEERKNLKKK